MSQIEIRVVTVSEREEDIKRLYEIMIYAYAVTEVEIWGENYTRMSPHEFKEVIGRGELIGVWVDGVPVGSIHVYQLKEETFAFGLFSVDFAFKGQNIGRKLIEAAELQAKASGGKFMELEVLRLKEKELAVKRRLHEWYLRLGYELVATIDFEDRKPNKADKVKNFRQPSTFDCYRKALN